MTKSNKDILDIWAKNIFACLEDVWGLVPQKVLPEYQEFYDDVIKRSKLPWKDSCEVISELKLHMFEPFIKWKHITWQQAIIVQSVQDAVNGEWPANISIRTWHGIGKSNILSKIICWFLICHYKSKIGLTAPDSQTLYDALFSEVWSALSSMVSPELASALHKTSDYLRVVWAEDEWFARCKTGKKENPEALAGLHAKNIMLIWEEASGLVNEILDGWESNLTWELNIFILIGNPLRNVGYFHDTFWNSDWRNLEFNWEDSPITWDYPQRVANKAGKDSDEYRRRILWKPPREDILDDKGYVQLVLESAIKKQADLYLHGEVKRLWVDCAWEGKDLTTWVLRDNLWAVILGKEKISNPKSIAIKTITLLKQFWVKPEDVFIDNFWAWADVSMEMTALGYKPSPVYVWDSKTVVNGEKVDFEHEGQKMLNLRAYISWLAKKWIEQWGIFSEHEGWKEATTIRYKRTLRDQIQIMSKEEMKRQWYKSPDYWDAFTLTFRKGIVIEAPKKRKKTNIRTDYSKLWLTTFN